LRDGAKVWGLGTRDSEDRLREIVGNRDARVLCIGPAGENLNRAAMLANDYNHFAAHSGGAVLGSKKLKAIVVSGSLRRAIAIKPSSPTPACAGASPCSNTTSRKRKPSTATATPGAR
jgi:aldehyde:ferredoxin oxidoreductase